MLESTLTLELQRLRGEVVDLGGLVESMILEAVDQLKRCDLDGLENLSADERQVREKRLAIEMACLQLIANEHPKDGDLRAAVSMMEIASELERIGEHAKRVARANCLALDHRLHKPMMSIHRLANEVQAMLDRVMEAFAQQDSKLARALFGDVQKVEARYEQTYQELIAVMNRHPRTANQVIYLSRAAYNLKRSAERAAGVCEWVVFAIAGTVGEAQSSPLDEITEEPTSSAKVAHS
jgi:phosphate transport system protein